MLAPFYNFPIDACLAFLNSTWASLQRQVRKEKGANWTFGNEWVCKSELILFWTVQGWFHPNFISKKGKIHQWNPKYSRIFLEVIQLFFSSFFCKPALAICLKIHSKDLTSSKYSIFKLKLLEKKDKVLQSRVDSKVDWRKKG